MRRGFPALSVAALCLAAAPLAAQSPSERSPSAPSIILQTPPAQSPIERLGGHTFTMTANDDACGTLVAKELALRLMKRVEPAPKAAQPAEPASLVVKVECGGEAPRFEASVSIAEASGTVLYKASGRTGSGFKGSQANFIASVVENIFVR